MRTFRSIVSIVLAVLGGSGLIISGWFDMTLKEPIPVFWQFLALAFFIIGVGLPVIWSQFEEALLSRIELVRYGLQNPKMMNVPDEKRFFLWKIKLTKRINLPSWYIQIQNNPRGGTTNIADVVAYITWYTEHGEKINENPGRWWIPSPELYVDKIQLQMVDLPSNGHRKLLHFAQEHNGRLAIWWRTDDDKSAYIQLPDGKYFVEFALKSTGGVGKVLGFQLDHSGNNKEMTLDKKWKNKKRKWKRQL